MKKIYMMEDLDCANCAARMEEAISRIEGVTSARVSYLAQKLILEADDARLDEIMAEGTRLPHHPGITQTARTA